MEDQQIPAWTAAVSAFLLLIACSALWFIAAEDCVDAGRGSIELLGFTCYVPEGSNYIPLGARPGFRAAAVVSIVLALAPAWVSHLHGLRKRASHFVQGDAASRHPLTQALGRLDSSEDPHGRSQP